MANLTYGSALNKGTLTITIGGSVDSDNSRELAAYCAKECEQAHNTLVLDMKSLEYISSAGLRVLLAMLKKEAKPVKALNVSSEVHEILEMTGFTKMLDASRALRRVSIDGCEKIGQGGEGSVYRLDKDSIIKVFRSDIPMEGVERERNLANQALLRGIPTAISYDIVRSGESYGVVYEMLDADTVSGHIIKEPDKLEHYAKEYAQTIKYIHSIDVSGAVFPDIRKRRIDRFRLAKERGRLTEEQFAGCVRFYEILPERPTFIHGDLNPNNLMIHNGELLLIDMGWSGFGHPILDIANIYLTTGFPGKLEGDLSEAMEGATNIMSAGQLLRVWQIFAREYFGTDDQDRLDALEYQCETFALLFTVLVGAGGVKMGSDEKDLEMSRAVGAAFFFPELEERYAKIDFALWGDAVDNKARRKASGGKQGLMDRLRGKPKTAATVTADPSKISIDSKIKDIIVSEAAMAILERHLPGISGNKQLKMAYGMTLRAVQKFPQAGISAEQLAEIERELTAL